MGKKFLKSTHLTKGQYPESTKNKNRFIRKKYKQIQKWIKNMNRHFIVDIYEANKHMTKCSSSLVIKTILRYHLTPVRMTIIKKSGDNRLL